MNIKPYIQIIRPSVCFLTVFALIVGGIISGQIPIVQIASGIGASWSPLIIILASLSAFLICGSGNVINDFFDYEIDKINTPHRPIPSGKISRRNALIFYAGLSAIGLFLSALVGWQYFVIALFSFAVLTMYGWKWKRKFVIKNLAVAALAGISFLAGGLMIGISLTMMLITVVAISFLGTWAREIFKDIEDKDGDAKQNIRTIGTKYSEKTARAIGLIILILAIISLMIPAVAGSISENAKLYYLGFSFAVMMICFFGIIQRSALRTQKMIKIAMYVVTLMFLVVSIV